MSEMRYRTLGSSGLQVSVVGLGCNVLGAKLDQDGTTALVDAAIDSGITLFDTADVYGGAAGPGTSERLLGQALRGRRDQVVVASKFGLDMGAEFASHHGAFGSRRYLRLAVEASLRRLQTDWIDLYQLHRWDGITPLEETLAALHELVVEGKVRYLGSSNLAGWQIADADWIARSQHHERFVSAQNHYSLLERGIEAEVLPACVAHGVGQLPYFPLASGLLTGKYRRGADAPAGSRLSAADRAARWLTDARLDAVEKLAAFAGERGVSLLDVAFGALAAQPGVTSVIAGATSPDQIRANVAAGAWVPDAADLAALDAIVPPPVSQ